MRAKRIVETFDNLESKQVNLDLEKIIIENIGILEVVLNKGQETKEYWINVLLYRADAEQNYGGEMIYQSENFKSKKKAQKEYNKISKSLENGDHVLKSDLNGNPIFKYMGNEYCGEYDIHQFARMLRESLENYENVIKNYKEIKKR